MDYEPALESSVAARATAVGVDPYELVLELMLQQDGHELLMLTHENYAHGSLDAIREMVLAEGAIMGTRLPTPRCCCESNSYRALLSISASSMGYCVSLPATRASP